MKLLLFIVFTSFSTALAACEPTPEFSNYIRKQNVFSSDNPKKEISAYALKNKIEEGCAYEMVSKLVPAMAVEWMNRSRELGCFKDNPGPKCPDITKNEIFGNIDLLDQWSAWLNTNKTTLPEISLCHDYVVDDNVDNFFSDMSPILTALKKEERMKLAVDLQKMNCNESTIVNADNSPNLEYFKKLQKLGLKAPLDDFLKLWYPKGKKYEEDPYFFKCQDKPWAPLTKKSDIEPKQLSEADLKIKKVDDFLKKFKKLTVEEISNRNAEFELLIQKLVSKNYKKEELAALVAKREMIENELSTNIDFSNISQEDQDQIIELKNIKAEAELINLKPNTLSYLAKECKPDVLYSWGPEVKLAGMQKTMQDGKEWANSPNPLPNNDKAALFMSMSPTSTFGYGNIAVRLKIKPSVPYKHIWGYVDSKEAMPNEIQVRTDQYQDFTTKDASVIESWSFGTPEHYDEIVSELLRFKEKKRAQLYFRKIDSDGIDQLYTNVDSYKTDEDILKKRLLNHIEMILQGRGRIVYQKGSCRNREQSFKTKRPTYFNPH